MIVFLIILAVIILILLIPVGADVSYLAGSPAIRLKVGFVGIRVFPGKELTDEERASKIAKRERKKAKKAARKAQKVKKEEEPESEPEKQRLKLKREDIFQIARLGLDIMSRFRKCLSIDVLHLKIVVSSEDPFDSVMRYGRLNAAVGTILPSLHRTFKIKEERIETDLRVDGSPLQLEGRLVLTIQIWESLFIGACAGIGFLKWRRAHKKRMAKNPA